MLAQCKQITTFHEIFVALFSAYTAYHFAPNDFNRLHRYLKWSLWLIALLDWGQSAQHFVDLRTGFHHLETQYHLDPDTPTLLELCGLFIMEVMGAVCFKPFRALCKQSWKFKNKGRNDSVLNIYLWHLNGCWKSHGLWSFNVCLKYFDFYN